MQKELLDETTLPSECILGYVVEAHIREGRADRLQATLRDMTKWLRKKKRRAAYGCADHQMILRMPPSEASRHLAELLENGWHWSEVRTILRDLGTDDFQRVLVELRTCAGSWEPEEWRLVQCVADTGRSPVEPFLESVRETLEAAGAGESHESLLESWKEARAALLPLLGNPDGSQR